MHCARFVLVVALIASAAPAVAGDMPEDPPAVPTGSNGEVVIVNGRASAMLSIDLGATSVPGFSARWSHYLKPDASITLRLVPASPCAQTVIAKFSDGATVHRAVDVCGGPVVLR